ncbi:MAG: hypothetical protein ABIA21_01640 [Candidatus Aenigmatarchaeota archaeon]
MTMKRGDVVRLEQPVLGTSLYATARVVAEILKNNDVFTQYTLQDNIRVGGRIPQVRVHNGRGVVVAKITHFDYVNWNIRELSGSMMVDVVFTVRNTKQSKSVEESLYGMIGAYCLFG